VAGRNALADLELPERNAEIGLVESVRNVPAERPVLASLLHDGVEEAEPVHQLVERLQSHRQHAQIIGVVWTRGF